MSGRNVKSAVRSLAVAVAMSAGTVASAQEAIMLETIGAVRMARPHEVECAAAEQEQSPAPRAQPRHEEREASAR